MDSLLASLLALLLPALAKVESNNQARAVGDNGRAVGILQIHPKYVQDVNRIAGTGYTLEDRKNPRKSFQMAAIYLTHYGKAYHRTTGKQPTLEVLARIHNGGPFGYRMAATGKYWSKVKRHLK